MATNIEANKIALVVIPARSKFWVLWCLDYAVRLRLEGFQVDLLDLSGYSPHWYRKHIRKLLMTLKFNNRLETISKKVCTQYQIRYIKPPRHLNKFFPEIDKSERLAFLSLLDAQYAPTLGRRVTSENLLPQRTLEIETYFYQATKEIITSLCRRNRYSIIATANGRLVVSGAVKVAAIESTDTCQILDTSVNGRWTYQVFKPDYLEDLDFIPDQIDELWRKANSEKVSIAQEALSRKLQGYRLDAPTWVSAYTTKFDPSIKGDKKLAVIFPTSDWERPLHLVRDLRMTFEGDQQIAFAKFIKVAQGSGYKIIVRAHPHPGDPSREKIENSVWKEFCDERGLILIASESGIDSYDLMEKSDLNVSYVSSAAIDSIILKRPTLVLGRSEFSHLISPSFAQDEGQIIEKLGKASLVIEESQLYPWSYFQEKGQISVAIIEESSDGRTLYKGKEIEKIAFKTLRFSALKLKKLIYQLPKNKLKR